MASGVRRNEAELSASPTITSPALLTGAGMILGTAAYMAPEQARGKTLDKRADIWAFGVHAFRLFDLPAHHADPFDRQIIAQALVEDIPVVTPDEAFRQYEGLRVVG